MDKEDYICIKRMTVALLIAFCLVSGFLLVLGFMGYANTIEESVFGKGTLDHSSYSKSASDRAMTRDAESVAYQMKRDWENESEQTFTSSFIVSGAGGSYRDQYVVKASGAGYKHTYRATKIRGDFSGSGESSVTMQTGTQGLDSLILMDGNATFQGRIINGQTGRPVAEAEMDAVGQFVIRSYLNVTEKPETPEDWLGFCAGLDDDTPNGLLIVPAGYRVEGGRILKNSTE
ncbi:MAG: hypothetical protein LUQ59_04500 [Methanothrix sp.]|nr:hypothetical protein [Methanothrix sp.]